MVFGAGDFSLFLEVCNCFYDNVGLVKCHNSTRGCGWFGGYFWGVGEGEGGVDCWMTYGNQESVFQPVTTKYRDLLLNMWQRFPLIEMWGCVFTAC